MVSKSLLHFSGMAPLTFPGMPHLPRCVCHKWAKNKEDSVGGGRESKCLAEKSIGGGGSSERKLGRQPELCSPMPGQQGVLCQ